MIEFFVMMIKSGDITLEDVPHEFGWYDGVKAILDKEKEEAGG